MFDNVILNELANHNLAPCQLIKRSAENKRTLSKTSKRDLNEHSFKSSAGGQLQTQKTNKFFSNHYENQSALTRNNSYKTSTNFVKLIHTQQNMNRKHEIRIYKGRFIRDEVKSLNPRSRKEDKLLDWQGTSDREESLSDPRWHK